MESIMLAMSDRVGVEKNEIGLGGGKGKYYCRRAAQP